MIRFRPTVAGLAAALTCLAPAARADLSPITGACGELDTELTDALPHLFVTDAGVEECDFVSSSLSPGGLEIFNDGTAGGSSLYSEILAHEIAFQCEAASLLKTETEIVYTNPNGKKTDFLVEIDAVKIGVSVTRAIVFPPGTPLSPAQALALLEDKLGDVLLSTANVDSMDAWEKQILVVETPSADDRDLLVSTVPTLDAATRADTIVWIVQTDGEDEFLYFGPDPECDLTTAPGPLASALGLRLAPNPLRAATTVSFALPQAGAATARVYDAAGRRVRTIVDSPRLGAGEHSFAWDGRADGGARVGAGVYFVRLVAGNLATTTRAVVRN